MSTTESVRLDTRNPVGETGHPRFEPGGVLVRPSVRAIYLYVIRWLAGFNAVEGLGACSAVREDAERLIDAICGRGGGRVGDGDILDLAYDVNLGLAEGLWPGREATVAELRFKLVVAVACALPGGAGQAMEQLMCAADGALLHCPGKETGRVLELCRRIALAERDPFPIGYFNRAIEANRSLSLSRILGPSFTACGATFDIISTAPPLYEAKAGDWTVRVVAKCVDEPERVRVVASVWVGDASGTPGDAGNGAIASEGGHVRYGDAESMLLDLVRCSVAWSLKKAGSARRRKEGSR